MANEVTSTADVKRALDARGLDGQTLQPIGTRPPLGQYVLQLWERRHFIWMDSSRRAATQNSRNRLGNVWLILRPIVDASFYFIIFGLILDVGGRVGNFPAFLLIGVLTFRATTRAITGGAAVLQGEKAMIRAFSFPRASIPIAMVLRDAMTAVFTSAVMCVAIILIPPHAFPRLSWLLIVPIFFLQCAMNLGITFITARLGFHMPDMVQVLAVLSRFLMYGSAVMFPITRFVDHPVAVGILELNPLFQLIDMLRVALIDGQVPALDSWLTVLIWTGFLVIGGFIYFWRGEASYGRDNR